jgi:dipeptidyl-peptidase-4
MVVRFASPRWLPPLLALLIPAMCVVVVTGQAPQTGQRPLTLDDLYSFEGWTRFNGNPIATMSWVPDHGPWLDDTHYLWPERDASGSGWLRVDAETGSSRRFFNNADLESALLKAGVAREIAGRAARQRPTNFNRRRDSFVVTAGNSLYSYNIPNASITRLTTSPEAKTEAAFSPDGRLVSFIKDNNLYVTEIAAPAERALTTDGTEKILNGVLDWVYSEELYGRGDYRAYWWSPDSSKIAFLQLDDSPVPEYTLVDDIPYHPVIETWAYPKAGDPNPIPRIFVVDIADALRRTTRTAGAQRNPIDIEK